MTPTKEQESIISANLKPGDVLKIVAYAGTGKTSTLELLARAIQVRDPKAKILYLAFNKSVAVEAKGRFPSNVVASTIHSIAYKKEAGPYKHKLEGDIRARLVAQALGVDVSLVKAGLEVMKAFLSSASKTISTAHVPELLPKNVSPSDALLWGQRIWEYMCEASSETVPMIHDGYLKLFHLKASDLGYQYIFLDEAQDSNPVTTDIVMSQSQAVKVLVGDPHQQIYSWRGAENAMEKIQCQHAYYLTNSFRFGQKVAYIANLILMYYKKENRPVLGLRGEGEVGFIDSSKPYTVLGRTNSGIFEEALRLQSLGIKIAVVGGAEALKVDQLKDAYRLFTKQNDYLKDDYMKTFVDFEDLEQYGKDYEDPEAKNLCKVIRKHPKDFHTLVQQLVSSLVEEKDAQVILSTAHKAKGLEWDQVKLLDDYIKLFDEQGELLHPRYHPVDEINLMYVAVTRAQKCLQINESIRTAILKIKLEYTKKNVS